MKAKPHKDPPKGSGARSYFVLAVLFTLAAGAVWFSINRENIREYTETYKNREAEIAEISDLKQRISQLKRKQQSLAFNGVESEKQIRERLQMHKPGERVIYLEDEGEGTSATPAAGKTVPIEASAESPAKEETKPVQSDQDENRETKPEKSTEIKSVYDAL